MMIENKILQFHLSIEYPKNTCNRISCWTIHIRENMKTADIFFLAVFEIKIEFYLSVKEIISSN